MVHGKVVLPMCWPHTKHIYFCTIPKDIMTFGQAQVLQSILFLRTASFILCRKNIIIATKISVIKIKSIAKYSKIQKEIKPVSVLNGKYFFIMQGGNLLP